MTVIPQPHRVASGGGAVRLTSASRIVIREKALSSLAEVLSQEIRQVTGLRLPVAQGDVCAGDILPGIDRSLSGESYRLEIDGSVRIEGGDCHAVALGTTTLVQLLDISDAGVTIPGLSIEDRPDSEYRGVMLDLARHPHSIGTLKQAVILCRFYKIRYLHLHFTDDQAFTFPSTAFSELAGSGAFTLEEMHELERFALDRGVTVIPEIDVPGHAAAMVGALREHWSGADHPEGVLCPGREAVYQILDTLVGEMCGVFQSSPYFHIGADEFDVRRWEGCETCQTYMAENGIEDLEELQRHFIVRMDRIVRAHGRKTIVWEGFAPGGAIEIPKDILVMVFESLYATAPELLAAGYEVINTSWQPLYVVRNRAWSPEAIYQWNPRRWENWWDKSRAFPHGIEVDAKAAVRGAQMCAWEQPDEMEIPSLRRRVAAMSERIWNPDAGSSFGDFFGRLSRIDERLEALLRF